MTEASLSLWTLLSSKHISLVRQLKVAFVPATIVIKSMTFRRLSEGGLLLMTGKCIPSLTPHYYCTALLQPPKTVIVSNKNRAMKNEQNLKKMYLIFYVF